jgi:predicted HAD superfamily phosphohydrolase
MQTIQLVTACEGPLALNDNAFELCRDFIKPAGDRFFFQVSRMDAYLAAVGGKEGYKAGDALKLILPFLRACGLTNAALAAHAEKTLRLVPGAEDAYRFLHTQNFSIFLMSAGYRQFAEVVGRRLGFQKERIIGTELDLDRYTIPEQEAAALKTFIGEIPALPDIEIPAHAKTPEEVNAETREAVSRMEAIFGEIIPGMASGRIYDEVQPVRGPQKARALEESLAQTGTARANVMYVGDGTTDVEAFKTVRAGGGVAVSFNGDREAIDSAEFIVVANNAWPIALLVAIFQRWGKEGVLELSTSSQAGHEKIVALPQAVVEPIVQGLQGRNFSFYPANMPDREKVIMESMAMRARLRGEAIAMG